MTRVLYIEDQKYEQRWLWLLLITISLLVITPLLYGFYRQIILGEVWGNNPMSDIALMLTFSATILLMAAVLWLYKTMTLRIKITYTALKISYKPMIKEKVFAIHEISSAKIRKYSAIKEYGGYGIRTYSATRKANGAYTVSGNMGLQLTFKNGKKLLIGTQNPLMLEKAINKALNNLDNNK